MGFSRGNEVFDPVAHAVRDLVNTNDLKESHARWLLECLIDSLQGIDWDTEDESLDKFKDVPYVVEAFRRCGIKLE